MTTSSPWTIVQADDLIGPVVEECLDNEFAQKRLSRIQAIIDDIDRSGTPHAHIDILSVIRDQFRSLMKRSDSAIIPTDRVGIAVKDTPSA